MRVGVWRPDCQTQIFDVSVLSARDLEYLAIAVEDSNKAPTNVVVVAPNWYKYAEEIAFWVWSKYFPDAELHITDALLGSAVRTWEQKSKDFSDVRFNDAIIFDIVAEFQGNRVAAFRESCKAIRDDLLRELICCKGVGDNKGNDKFLVSMPSHSAFISKINQCDDRVCENLGKCEAAYPLREFLTNLKSTLIECTSDPVGDRIVHAAILEASGLFWANRSNFQLAFLHLYRALDAVLQAIVIDLGLLKWDRQGYPYFRESGQRQKKIKATVGSVVHALEQSGKFVGAGPLERKISKVNEKRNDSLLGHSVCGLEENDLSDAFQALDAAVKFIPDSRKGAWRRIKGNLDLEIKCPLWLPFELIDDFESGVEIRPYPDFA